MSLFSVTPLMHMNSSPFICQKYTEALTRTVQSRLHGANGPIQHFRDIDLCQICPVAKGNHTTLICTELYQSQSYFLTLNNLLLQVFSITNACACIRLQLNNLLQRDRTLVYLVSLHFIKCMTVEDAHQPGAKWTARLETRQTTPGHKKC